MNIWSKFVSFVVGSYVLVREFIAYLEKAQAHEDGYKEAVSDSKSTVLTRVEESKKMDESDEKLSDDELDHELASGMYTEKRDSN